VSVAARRAAPRFVTLPFDCAVQSQGAIKEACVQSFPDERSSAVWHGSAFAVRCCIIGLVSIRLMENDLHRDAVPWGNCPWERIAMSARRRINQEANNRLLASNQTTS